jgi:hypothetical protein
MLLCCFSLFFLRFKNAATELYMHVLVFTLAQVLIQLLSLPPSITSSRQLSVTFEPYSIRVQAKTTGEVFLQGELARGIVPEDSTWTFIPVPQSSSSSSSSRGVSSVTASSGGGGAGAVVCTAGSTAVAAVTAEYGEGKLLLQLAKMNLELYGR